MKRHVSIPRQQSLIVPEVQNPFYHRIRLGRLDLLKVVLMSLTVAPIRLLLAGFCLLIAWPIAALALLGREKDEEKVPLAGWRKFIHQLLGFIGRCVFFLCGFHKVAVRGQRASMTEAPLVCVAPHSSFWDAIIMFIRDIPSVISRKENSQIPLLGSMYICS